MSPGTDVAFVGIAVTLLFPLGMRLIQRWLVPWTGRGRVLPLVPRPTSFG